MNESRLLALVLPLVVWLGGCGVADTRSPKEPPAIALPAWLGELPEQSVEAAAGERVWAVVPEKGSEAARVSTYRVAETSGAEAVLIDDLGNRLEGVPGALVHPLSGFPQAELAAGIAVLADRWDTGGVVGQAVSTESGEVEVAFDWNGSTATAAMGTVVPLSVTGDSLILRWVAYPAPGEATWHKGLCFAESSARLWIRDDGGYVEVVARDSVKLLADQGPQGFAVGAEVTAYSWDQGYRSGVIEKVIEPGLRFAVKIEDGESRAFFFADLTAAL